MKKSLLATAFFFAVSTLSAQTGRAHLNFDEGWKFHFGNASSPAMDFNYGVADILAHTGDAGPTCINTDFKDDSWAAVQLPHDWVVSLPFEQVANGDVEGHGYHTVGGLFPESSIGWYRKSFTVDKVDSGRRFVLQFDGIFRDSKVWINGCYLGGNFSGYTGSSFDITDFIHFSGQNIIVVRVDATQYEGWFYEGGGIYRHAWLNIFDNLHMCSEGGLYIRTHSSGDKAATVTVTTRLENSYLQSKDGTVSTYITDREGRRLAATREMPVSLDVNGKSALTDSVVLSSPRLWSLEDPYLYRAVVIVRSGGNTVDSETVKFGIRTIVIDNEKGLFVNGVPVKVRGVCCHQDHAGVGSALPDYLQYYRIGLLKEMGVNAYRSSHNPPTPELLDACDSLGMLVLDETRMLNSGAEYGTQWQKLILCDRNHPCVFLWSIGNEESKIQGTSTGKRIAQNQILKARELDPSRTCTYAANNGKEYYGVNEVIPVRGFNYILDELDPYRKAHPNQPVIGTEVASSVATRGIFHNDPARAYVVDYDSVAVSWGMNAEEWWNFALARSWFMGGFVWTGFDYRGEPTPYGWPNINSHFGIMDICGFPKSRYYYYQSWWTDKDVLHITPHWNWKGQEGKPIPVWVYTNADNVELFLNGKSLGKKDMPRNGHLEWIVNYTPGKLEAVAYKKGRKLRAIVQTTGEGYQLVLKPSKSSLLGDGRDAVVCNISVLDRQGLEVPDAGNLVHFSVSGGGHIIGVGNGDPSSHEPDKFADDGWQRHLFNGQCQVILQAKKGTDALRVTVFADGLQPAIRLLSVATK
jgi:beta-galactosidase